MSNIFQKKIFRLLKSVRGERKGKETTLLKLLRDFGSWSKISKLITILFLTQLILIIYNNKPSYYIMGLYSMEMEMEAPFCGYMI